MVFSSFGDLFPGWLPGSSPDDSSNAPCLESPVKMHTLRCACPWLLKSRTAAHVLSNAPCSGLPQDIHAMLDYCANASLNLCATGGSVCTGAWPLAGNPRLHWGSQAWPGHLLTRLPCGSSELGILLVELFLEVLPPLDMPGLHRRICSRSHASSL